MLAKEIAVNGQCYIYDGYTNKIVPSEKYCEAPHKQYNGIVEKPISMRQTDRYENLHTMILQITRNCNMRCTYCVYSGHFSYAFPHAEESMSLDTIRRAIDFFEEHSRGSDEAAICFYGGEALIVFDDVQYAIQYAEEKMKNRKLNFGIISNGLLLNERIVDYLCQHSNVSVQVTLNGMDHDDSRKDISGNGTLARIIKNMQSIRFGHPQVWEHQVNFTANIKSYADIEGLQIFYQNYVGKEPTLITRISTRGCAEEIASQYTYDEKEDRRLNCLFRERFVQDPNSFYKVLYQEQMSYIHNRPILSQNRGKAFVLGCIPAANKLFVNTDGVLNICERVPDRINLGDIKNGYCDERIDSYYSQMKAFVNRNCMGCWCQHLCSLCFSDLLDENGEIIETADSGVCKRVRLNAELDLKTYIGLIIRHPDALENIG